MAKAKPIKNIDTRMPLLAAAGSIIQTRLEEMLAFEEALSDARRVAEAHQMRIAAKRLRYSLELFQDAYQAFSPLGAQFAAATGEVVSLQEALGALHDADVLVPKLTAHLARNLRKGSRGKSKAEPPVGVDLVDFEACAGLLRLCKEIRAKRQRGFTQLQKHWQDLKDKKFFENLQTLLERAAEKSAPGETSISDEPEKVKVEGKSRVAARNGHGQRVSVSS